MSTGISAGTAYIELVPKLSDDFANRVRNDVERATVPVMQAASEKLNQVGTSLMGFGRRLTTFVTLPLALAGVAAFNLASDLNESISKAQVVFGDYFADVDAWSRTSARAMGLSRQEALESASTFGNLFRAMGIGTPIAAGMSKELIQLAADMASFNNTSVQDAIVALRSGMVGEAEPLRRYGVQLSSVRVEEEARALGINKTYAELTSAEKAQAIYAAVLEDTALQQGDYGRTAEGAANKQRTMIAGVKDLAASIGTRLMPIGQKLLGWADKVLELFNGLSPTMQNIALGLVLVAAAAGPVVGAIGAVATVLGFIIGNPIVLVLAAIAAAAFLLYKNWDEVWPEIQRVAAEVFAWLDEHAGFVVDAVRGIIAGVIYVKDHWREIWEEVQRVAGEVWAWLEENVVPVFEKIAEGITVAMDRISDVIDIGVAIIKYVWENFGATILEYVVGVWNGIVTVIDGVLQFIGGIVDIFIGIFTLDWDTFWSGIKDVVGGIWTAIIGVVDLAINIVKAVINTVLDALGIVWDGAWSGIKTVVSGIWDTIKTVVSDGINAVAGFIGELPGRVLGFLGKLAEAGKSLGGAIIDGIKNGITGAGNVIADVAGAIFDAFKRGWNVVANTINDAIPDQIGFDTPFGFLGVNLPDNPLPRLHSGGIVPGRRGEEVLALVLAGEEVSSIDDVERDAGGGGDHRQYVFHGVDKRDVLTELSWSDFTSGRY